MIASILNLSTHSVIILLFSPKKKYSLPPFNFISVDNSNKLSIINWTELSDLYGFNFVTCSGVKIKMGCIFLQIVFAIFNPLLSIIRKSL